VIKTKTFPFGEHTPGMKETATFPVKVLPPPERVLLHLSQHKGAPAIATKKMDDDVLYGDLLAEASGHVSVPIHASISGKITGFGNFLHPMGSQSSAFLIRRDPSMPEPALETETDLGLTRRSEILQKIKDAGIVGMGGATFPTHVKLSPPEEFKIDTVIINGSECEPVLTADHRSMLEYPDELISGLKICVAVLKADRGIIAIEDNKQDAADLLTAKLEKQPSLQVQLLRTKYPQGSEKHLILACTGRRVKSGQLPASTGVVVINASTAIAISNAVIRSKPLTERIVTLAGSAVKNPGNYKVRIGTIISDFIEATGGLKEDITLRKVISGGPMMGFALPSLELPIQKGTAGILCWTDEELAIKEETHCIRCARCVRACPMGLDPTYLMKLLKAQQFEKAKAEKLLDCIECGACSYTCPAAIPLAQYFVMGKRTLMAQQKNKK